MPVGMASGAILLKVPKLAHVGVYSGPLFDSEFGASRDKGAILALVEIQRDPHIVELLHGAETAKMRRVGFFDAVKPFCFDELPAQKNHPGDQQVSPDFGGIRQRPLGVFVPPGSPGESPEGRPI
jgi:hypothetical protein